MKLHEQREVDKALGGNLVNKDDQDEEVRIKPFKRRRGGEIGRDWKCDVEGCERDFKSV
jgi:general transcription factor IIIA